jgi:hypothetical protein
VRVKPETVTEETDENEKQISAGKKN